MPQLQLHKIKVDLNLTNCQTDHFPNNKSHCRLDVIVRGTFVFQMYHL